MYKELLKKIREYENIAIYRHIHPDGDAMFSTLALYTFLKHNFPEKNSPFLNFTQAKAAYSEKWFGVEKNRGSDRSPGMRISRA